VRRQGNLYPAGIPGGLQPSLPSPDTHGHQPTNGLCPGLHGREGISGRSCSHLSYQISFYLVGRTSAVTGFKDIAGFAGYLGTAAFIHSSFCSAGKSTGSQELRKGEKDLFYPSPPSVFPCFSISLTPFQG